MESDSVGMAHSHGRTPAEPHGCRVEMSGSLCWRFFLALEPLGEGMDFFHVFWMDCYVAPFGNPSENHG